MVEVERVSMLTTLASLQSALTLQGAVHLVRKDPHALVLMEGSNPFAGASDRGMDVGAKTEPGAVSTAAPVLALAPPKKYLGALERPDPRRIPGGSWYFDKGERVLVYRVRHEAHFESALPGPKRARFAVRVVYQDANSNHQFDPNLDAVQAVKLEAVEPFHWLDAS